MKRSNIAFQKKFSLLNSQETSEEIVWSCSNSSDETSSQMYPRKNPKKREKRQNKKLFTNTMSNLDFIICNASDEESINGNTSRLTKIPSNICKNNMTIVKWENQQSESPVFKTKSIKKRSRSPILNFKSKGSSPNVCKKLFNRDENNASSIKKKCLSPTVDDRCQSPILKQNIKDISNQNSICLKEKANLDLIENVKTYQRNLSTDSLSQNSISEYSTPKNSSKTSDEVDIVDITQVLPQPIKIENSPPQEYSTVKSKKVKYKKDGLAYRLDKLLKKQTANISLWQHEQYLATNSNFIIPKESFLAFRIKTVDCKFGCYLIQAINDKDELYLILINTVFVKQKIAINCFLKLYEPYKILNFNEEYKLIVNVSKFICEYFKS